MLGLKSTYASSNRGPGKFDWGMWLSCHFRCGLSKTYEIALISMAQNFIDDKLYHWGRVTHTCISKLTIIVSDNVLVPGQQQAIIWTCAGILLIRMLGTNFSKILCEIHTFSMTKMHLKMSSAKWQQFYLGLNGLMLVHVMAWYDQAPSHEPVLTNSFWQLMVWPVANEKIAKENLTHWGWGKMATIFQMTFSN